MQKPRPSVTPIALGLVLGGVLSSCVGAEDVGSVGEALTSPQIVEGETATGAGTVLSDVGASGGQYLRNTTPFTTATASFSTSGAIVDGVVRARRGNTLCIPILEVRLDGAIVASVSVSATSWTDYPLSSAAAAGAHTLTLYYRSGSAGCALDVDQATFDVDEPPPPPAITALEAELATGAGTIENDASASAGQLRRFTQMATTATLAFTLPDPLVGGTVTLRGGSCGPVGRVSIDGVVVWTGRVYQSSWTTFPISAPAFGAGPHTLELFARSAYASCPLDVDVVSLETAPPPPPPVTTYVEAESASGGGAIESDPSASGGLLRTFTAPRQSASAQTTTDGTMLSGTVTVRGGACLPYGSVTIDGITVWSGYVGQSTWTDVPLTTTPFPAGTHTVGFVSRSASASCPLRFDRLTWVSSAP